MGKSTKKMIFISLIVIFATIGLLYLFMCVYLAGIRNSHKNSQINDIVLEQKPAATTNSTVVETASTKEANASSIPAESNMPKNLVGNLPMAPLSGNKFTQETLFGYGNSLALITAVHKKTLKILAEAGNLKPVVLQMALRAYTCAQAQDIGKLRYLTIIDYSLPSTTPRMWVIDLKNASVPFHTLVAHGKNSGYINTTTFSNSPGSDSSSIGLFLTGNTYIGHNGYSLKLKGLEKGFNDNALQREVVIHGAAYVSSDFVKTYGRLGRSWGCPALSKAVSTPVINDIKNGTLLFAYYPQPGWEKNSTYLHCSVPLPWHW